MPPPIRASAPAAEDPSDLVGHRRPGSLGGSSGAAVVALRNSNGMGAARRVHDNGGDASQPPGVWEVPHAATWANSPGNASAGCRWEPVTKPQEPPQEFQNRFSKQEIRGRRARQQQQQHRRQGDRGIVAKGGGKRSGASPSLLLQVCWDFHSPDGCQRQGCKWRHCPLDGWQVSWLRLQRFVFGAQLNTFDSIASLAQAAHIAFAETANGRLQTETPPTTAASLRSAVFALGRLGYPFPGYQPTVQMPPENSRGGLQCNPDGGRAGRIELLEALRLLAARELSPGTQVLPVGSFAWGIDTDGSDLDVVLAPLGGGEEDVRALDCLARALELPASDGALPQALQGATFVLRGRGTGVPVLTVFASADGQRLSVDICCAGQLSSVRDALLFRHMIARTPLLGTTLQLFKRWLRQRAIPSSSEGCFPQIFWMRLAARTLQQAAAAVTAATEAGSASADGSASQRPTFADWSAAPGSHQEAQAALRMASAPRASGRRSDRGIWACASGSMEELTGAAHQLGGFCAWWSVMLPGWGDPLNLAGEDLTPQLKRLGAGVYGATALLCLHELREMASAQVFREAGCVEKETPVPPHRHLCPAEAGFWGVFLVPSTDSDADADPGVSAPPCMLLVAFVYSIIGPTDGVRQCVCPSCCHAASRPAGGCSKMLDLNEICSGVGRCPAKTARKTPQEYLSRRDSDWMFWVSHVRSALKDRECGDRSVPQGRPFVVSPTHLVTTLPADPVVDAHAASELSRLCSLVSPLDVAQALPPAYPRLRYSRRLLLAVGCPGLACPLRVSEVAAEGVASSEPAAGSVCASGAAPPSVAEEPDVVV